MDNENLADKNKIIDYKINKTLDKTSKIDKEDKSEIESRIKAESNSKRVSESKITGRIFLNNILNGLSVAIVVALIPSALLGQLMLALKPIFPFADEVIVLTNFCMSLLPVIAGFCVSMQFKLSPIQSSSVAMASMVGSGALIIQGGDFILKGTGDVINIGLTVAFAVGVILLVGEKLKAYTILLIPSIVLLTAGVLGIITLPYVKFITQGIGQIISQLTLMQPVPMCILISISFAIIIVSPVSSVAIATAVTLTGIGSGAANLGICATAFGLAIMGWSVNSLGTSLAHFIGSPKIQMSNVIKKPKIMVPLIINAGILGALAAIFNIGGTPMSAGFGISGFIGPIAYLNSADGGYSILNLLIAFILFIVIPIVLGILGKYLFQKYTKFIEPDDLLISYD